MKFIIVLILLLTVTLSDAFAQRYTIRGKISDGSSKLPLEFAFCKVADTTFGTTADDMGQYILKLERGNHSITYSHLGYNSQTVHLNVTNDTVINIELFETDISTDEIIVTGEDPAYEIIRKAIRYKKQFQSRLNEYSYDAFSKMVLRSNRSTIDKSAEKDKLPIFAILESETKGYFKKPDLEKQIVLARRETANITRGVAIPLLVNFYDEDVDLQEVVVPGPLADDAFDHYEYKLDGTTGIDSLTIYRIDVINTSNRVPQFYGTIYIADSIFSLMKVNLTTNDAAKVRAVDKINFQQQFTEYKDAAGNKFWVPTDVQLTAEGSLAGVILFEAEAYSIISSYSLNTKAPPGTFDEYLIKVSSNAEKDSTYWKEKQLIQNTSEEQSAYKEIELDTKDRERSISLGLTSLNFGTKFQSSPLSYYRFNRVEGNHLQLNLRYRAEQNVLNASGYFGYGFSDKKSKYSLSYNSSFLRDRSLRAGARIFDELVPLSYELFGMAEFYNSGKALLDKRDSYDYFYTSGWSAYASASYIPQLRLRLNYLQEKQRTAVKNTDFSIRKKDVKFSENPPINDAFQRTVGFSLTIDPNTYRRIDWGDDTESRFPITNLPRLELSYSNTPKNLGSSFDYRTYNAVLNGRNNLHYLLNLRYKAGIHYQNGDVPFQSLLYFNSNTGGLNLPIGFKTMDYQEYLGDKQLYLNLENNLGNILWGGIPYIKRSSLILFYNAGRVDISERNKNLASYKSFSQTDGIFHEAGLGIANILDLFRVDFAWRLNNFRDGRNFKILFSLSN